MVTTAVEKRTANAAKSPIVLETWQEGLVTLSQQTDRNDATVYIIRMRLGTMQPWIIGPYTSKTKAREDFSIFVTELDGRIEEFVNDAACRVSAEINREF